MNQPEDLIFTSYNNYIVESGADDPADPSLDHELVFVSISTHTNNCRACYKRHVGKYDEMYIYDQIPWHLLKNYII